MFLKTLSKLRNVFSSAIWKIRKKECIDVLYKSSNYIVVNKPCNMFPYKRTVKKFGMLEKWFGEQKQKNGKQKQKKNIIAKPGTVDYILLKQYPEISVADLQFCMRLDFATSGVMCMSLCYESNNALRKAVGERTVDKYYVAILDGHIQNEISTVDLPLDLFTLVQIRTTPLSKQHMIHPQPKSALTKFVVLEKGYCFGLKATKVLTRIYSGRRHQIRAHAAYMKHAVLGDDLYSGEEGRVVPRLLLHCLRVQIYDPPEPIDVVSKDPFTEDNKDIRWCSCIVVNKLEEETYRKLRITEEEIAMAEERRNENHNKHFGNMEQYTNQEEAYS